MDAEGYVYETIKRGVVKIDSRTGKTVQHFPFTRLNSTYDNIVSADGRYWSGGQTGTGIVGLLDTKTGEMWELDTRTPVSSPARGGFDLVRLNIQTGEFTEYLLPHRTNVRHVEVQASGALSSLWLGDQHGNTIVRVEPLAP